MKSVTEKTGLQKNRLYRHIQIELHNRESFWKLNSKHINLGSRVSSGDGPVYIISVFHFIRLYYFFIFQNFLNIFLSEKYTNLL